ncbi:MAG: DUF2478 domain-containing protein [Alphaproteobacteria bacterium]|nr:DUF2478 domain-containing protein [Alphaproteobacteria bacterium]
MIQRPTIGTIVYDDADGPRVDSILAEVVCELRRSGVRLAGAVQHNSDGGDRSCCDMRLEDLGTGRLIEISERRGPEARGCRLNHLALEDAVGLATASIEAGADLLIVNKFGKREADGRGFLPLVGMAIERSTAVLIAVSASNIAAWNDFAAGLDERLPVDMEAARNWCRSLAPEEVL